jgi:L-aminopeptidase/D-esterase-like protein
LPNAALGYEAAVSASDAPVRSGPFGAGYSASSGKIGDPSLSSPSGLGSMGYQIGDLQIAALAVVNPLGSLIDPENGAILSGLKNPGGGLATREGILRALSALSWLGDPTPRNTTLVVVATNAALDKLDLFRLSLMASAGIARAVYPAYTPFDGDTVFALSTGLGPPANLAWLGALAAEAVSQAIVNSVPA